MRIFTSGSDKGAIHRSDCVNAHIKRMQFAERSTEDKKGENSAMAQHTFDSFSGRTNAPTEDQQIWSRVALETQTPLVRETQAVAPAPPPSDVQPVLPSPNPSDVPPVAPSRNPGDTQSVPSSTVSPDSRMAAPITNSDVLAANVAFVELAKNNGFLLNVVDQITCGTLSNRGLQKNDLIALSQGNYGFTPDQQNALKFCADHFEGITPNNVMTIRDLLDYADRNKLFVTQNLELQPEAQRQPLTDAAQLQNAKTAFAELAKNNGELLSAMNTITRGQLANSGLEKDDLAELATGPYSLSPQQKAALQYLHDNFNMITSHSVMTLSDLSGFAVANKLFDQQVAQTPSPSPTPQEVTPTPSPSPTPQEVTPTPSPSPTPQEVTPTPSPSPAPQEVTPTPSPSPAPQEVTPTPSPSPAPQDVTPTPSPSPAPQEVTPTPSPSPTPQEVTPTPSPSPTPQDVTPTPSPSPTPQEVTPTPSPSPTPQEVTPTPALPPMLERMSKLTSALTNEKLFHSLDEAGVYWCFGQHPYLDDKLKLDDFTKLKNNKDSFNALPKEQQAVVNAFIDNWNTPAVQALLDSDGYIEKSTIKAISSMDKAQASAMAKALTDQKVFSLLSGSDGNQNGKINLDSIKALIQDKQKFSALDPDAQKTIQYISDHWNDSVMLKLLRDKDGFITAERTKMLNS
jgi:hypothetical protein